MDDGVKQRIVGAFVLLALLVIILPVFFDSERIEPVDRETQIPLSPEFEEAAANIEEIEIDLTKDAMIETDKPQAAPKKAVAKPEKQVASKVVEPKKVSVAPAKVFPTMPANKSVPAKSMFTPNENAPQTVETVKPKLDKNGVPQSWVLQVGSFRFEGHAKQMRDDLIEMGYRSFVRDIEIDNSKMTRVYVGPKLDKSRLMEAQKAVEEKYKLKGILLKFDP